MDQQLLMMLPNLEAEELFTIQNLFKEMNAQEKQQFIVLYQGKRKDQQTLLLLTLLGFFGFAGIQRMVVNQVGLGIIYSLTLGFCFIGTIIDLFSVRRMANDYNQRQAFEAATMVKMMYR